MKVAWFAMDKHRRSGLSAPGAGLQLCVRLRCLMSPLSTSFVLLSLPFMPSSNHFDVITTPLFLPLSPHFCRPLLTALLTAPRYATVDKDIAEIKRVSILQRASFVGSRLTVFHSLRIARASSSNAAAWRGEISPRHKLKLIKLPVVQLSKSGVAPSYCSLIFSARQHAIARYMLSPQCSICQKNQWGGSPSDGWISQKRLKLGSCNLHHTVAHG